MRLPEKLPFPRQQSDKSKRSPFVDDIHRVAATPPHKKVVFEYVLENLTYGVPAQLPLHPVAGKVPTPLRDKSNQGQNPDRVHPSKAWRRGRVCPTVPANSFIAVSMFCVCVLCLCFVFD